MAGDARERITPLEMVSTTRIGCWALIVKCIMLDIFMIHELFILHCNSLRATSQSGSRHDDLP